MHNDLLYATGKVVVKDRKQDLNVFFTMSLRNRNLRFHAVQDSSHPDDLFQSRYVNPGFILSFCHYLEYNSVILSNTRLFSLLTT